MISLDDIAEEYEKARKIQPHAPYAEDVLRKLLLRGLPPRQAQALDILRQTTGAITSNDIARALGIGQNHACNILNRLCDLYLARRERTISETGMRFDYYFRPRWHEEGEVT